MTPLHPLERLAMTQKPDDGWKERVRSRVLQHLEVPALRRVAASVQPSDQFALTVRQRLLNSLDLTVFADVLHRPLIGSSVRWASAFAAVIVAVRLLPVIFLAPSTFAGAGVQAIPVSGVLEMNVGGLWRDVSSPLVLDTATMLRTGPESEATVLFHDDGVLRMAPDTVLKIHDLSDRPSGDAGLTATLVRGRLWVLGLLPPVDDGLSIDMGGSLVSVNIGSADLEQLDGVSRVTIFDRGATVRRGSERVLAVGGDTLNLHASVLHATRTPQGAATNAWVTQNLESDAVHRTAAAEEFAKRQRESAGILPTSFLYPAKRLAEHVDVFFTLTQDGRTEKRIAQANSRLVEALALLKSGASDEAALSLAEYKGSILAIAGSDDNNIVRDLLLRHTADASVTLGDADLTPSLPVVAAALAEIGSSVPDAELESSDIEGYVLVDRLASIVDRLRSRRDIDGALRDFVAIRPFIQPLIRDESSVHPLLKKEAVSLLVSLSHLAEDASLQEQKEKLSLLAQNIAPLLPDETSDILALEAMLTSRVKDMYDRIFIFRAPLSRFNQLQIEMEGLRSDPHRGTLLRRLKAALPEKLGSYVNTEIRELRNELRQ